MRILLLSTSSGSRGGGELHLRSLGSALSEQGHEVALWASSHERMDELCALFSPFGSVYRADYANTYDHPLRSLRHVMGASNVLGECLAEFSPDVLHLNKQNLEDGLDLVAEIDATGLPSVCFTHITHLQTRLGGRFGWLRDKISRRSLRAYSRTLATNSNCVDDLNAFLGQERAHVIDNGVKIPEDTEYDEQREKARRDLGLDPGTTLVVAVGRLEPQKRPQRFARVVASILKQIPNSRAIWVGDGSLRSEVELSISEAGLDDRIQLAGWKEDVFPYLAAADLYVHPAAFEGLPYSILEAMAWRNPPILYSDLAEDLPFLSSSNAFIIEEGSPVPDLSDAVTYGRNAPATIADGHSTVAMARNCERLYRAMM